MQSIVARTPGSRGRPVSDAVHSTPANLSSDSFANLQHSSSWPWASTFTQNRPVAAISAHECEFTPGRKPTSAGSSETDTNEPIVMPRGVPSVPKPVTTTTDVGTWPSTWRNFAESKTSVTPTE